MIPAPQPKPRQAAAATERAAESPSALGQHQWGSQQRGPGSEARTTAGSEAVPTSPGRWVHSHPCGERARRGAAGRGRQGSESWPELPLTQCLEALEGRQRQAARGCPSLSSRGRNTRMWPERRVSPSPRPHQDNCPRDKVGPLPTLSRGVKVRAHEGGFSKLQWDLGPRNGGPLLRPGPSAR